MLLGHDHSNQTDNRTQRQTAVTSLRSTHAQFVVNSQSKDDDAKKYKKIYCGLALIHLIIGTTCVALGVTLIHLSNSQDIFKDGFSMIGCGIWCGAFFLVSGVIGIVAGRNFQTCSIISSIVTTILSILASLTLLGLEVWAAFLSGVDYYGPSRTALGLYRSRDPQFNPNYEEYYDDNEQLITYKRVNSAGFAIHVTLCFLAFIEVVISIVHSIYCCIPTCCKQVTPVICVTCPTQLNQLQRTTIRETGQLVTHANQTQPTYVCFEPRNAQSVDISETLSPLHRDSPPPSYEENCLKV